VSKLVRWTRDTAEQHAQAIGVDPCHESYGLAVSSAQGISQMEIGDREQPPSGYAFVDPANDQDDDFL
jgi:hypothetical protein